MTKDKKENKKSKKKHLFQKKAAKKLKKKSDDFILTSRPLSVIYNNVPEHLQNVEVMVLELHRFPKDKKKEILEWLNRDDNPSKDKKNEDTKI